VWAANGTIQTSDRREKKNITPLTYGLSEVMKLRPVEFSWSKRPDDRRHLGLIAQDVEEVIPEAVWRDEDSSKPLGLNYNDFVPVLVNAIQAQQEMISAQQKELRDHALRIARLEERIALGHHASTSATLPILAFGALPILGLVVLRRQRAKP
jgi:hypothetical protein